MRASEPLVRTPTPSPSPPSPLWAVVLCHWARHCRYIPPRASNRPHCRRGALAGGLRLAAVAVERLAAAHLPRAGVSFA